MTLPSNRKSQEAGNIYYAVRLIGGNAYCESDPASRLEPKIQENTCAGNPIDFVQGVKLQSELDYRGYGHFPLSVLRVYSSASSGVLENRWQFRFSGAETHRLDTSLATSDNLVRVLDARNYFVVFSTSDGVNYTPDSDVGMQLTFNGGQWTLVSSSDQIELFDSAARPVSVTRRGGAVHSYVYTATGFIVTDDNGRQLSIVQDALGRVQSVILPDASTLAYQYRSDKLLSTVSYPDSTTKQYGYKRFGRLSSITDEIGNVVASFEYDTQGRAIETQHIGGVNQFHVDYGASSRTITNPLGHQTVYQLGTVQGGTKVTGTDRLASTYCAAAQQARVYDANGYVQLETDFNGNQIVYVRNTRGLAQSTTVAAGTADARTTTVQWHSQFRLPEVITEPGRTITYVYSPYDNPNYTQMSVTDTATGEVRTWSYTYNTQGQVLTEDGPRVDVSDVTSYTYYNCANGGACGQLATMVNALGQTTTFDSYNAHGQPTQITDSNGQVTTLSYNTRQWMTQMNIAGAITTMTYDAKGNVTRVTQPDATYLNYTFDNADRLIAINDAEGNRVEWTLDNAGNRTNEVMKDPGGQIKKTLGTSFDELSRVRAMVYAHGGSVNYAYDKNDNLISQSDASNRVTTSIFDALDRLIKTVDPLLGETDFVYDDRDNLISITDAEGLSTTYTYNGFDDRISAQSPDTGLTTYTYDSAGNVLTQTDARNIQVGYSYDALNRITSISYPDATENISYSYDQGANGVGLLTGITDASGSTTLSYDARGNIVTITTVIEGQSYTQSFTYNAADRMKSQTFPSGRTVTYTYDTSGRISDVTSNGVEGLEALATGITRLPFGPMSGLSLGNGLQRQRNYDQDYRVLTMDDGGVFERGFAYNTVNNVTAITDTLNSANSQFFTYDDLDRLEFAAGGYGDDDYTYDAIGNRLSFTRDGQSETYQYSASSHHLQSRGGVGYTHDAVGNTISDSGASFTYNERNRMESVTVGGLTTTYRHNAMGQRVLKDTGGVETHYVYDLGGRVIMEANGSGTVQVEYSYLDEEPLTMWRDTPPEPAADFEFSSSGSTTDGKWQVFQFEVTAGELIEGNVTWDDPNANVKIFLRDENNTQIANDTDDGSPAMVSATARTSGTWSIGVSIVSGATNYAVLVDTNSDVTPPEPAADFEFSSSGSTTDGKWQVFQFEVNAGELIEGEVIWDDPDADVRIFLRDENGTQIANDTDGGLPAIVSATAGSSGTWSIGVSIKSGSVNYDVLVNTSSGVTPPETAADFEFSSSGSTTEGKWQVFQFEVNAGELIEGEVIWDDPDADVRIFLRDENGTQVANDTDGGLPAMVSATAGSSGTWSIGVSIKSGTVNYDVLVNAVTGGQ